MTRKDYQLIADALNANKPHELATEIEKSRWAGILYDLGQALKSDNPRFDYGRFREACNAE